MGFGDGLACWNWLADRPSRIMIGASDGPRPGRVVDKAGRMFLNYRECVS